MVWITLSLVFWLVSLIKLPYYKFSISSVFLSFSILFGILDSISLTSLFALLMIYMKCFGRECYYVNRLHRRTSHYIIFARSFLIAFYFRFRSLIVMKFVMNLWWLRNIDEFRDGSRSKEFSCLMGFGSRSMNSLTWSTTLKLSNRMIVD